MSTFLADVKKLFRYFQDTQTSQLKVEKATLMSYLGEVQESFDVHQRTISDLQLQQVSLEEESVQLNRQVSELQLQLKNKESEINSMKHLDHELNTQEHDDQVEQLEKRLKEIELELIRECNEKKKAEEKLRETLAMHKREKEQATEEIQQLKNKVVAVEGEINQKNFQLDHVNINHQTEMSRLNNELQQVQEKIMAAVNETRESSLVNEGLKTEVIDLKSNIEVKEDELKKQKDSVQSLELRLLSQGKENKVLKEELSATQQLLSSEREAVQRTLSQEQSITEQQRVSQLTLQNQLDIVKAENESLKIERDKLIDDLSSETKKYSVLQTAMNEMKSRIEEKEVEIRLLQQERAQAAEGTHTQDNVWWLHAF